MPDVSHAQHATMPATYSPRSSRHAMPRTTASRSPSPDDFNFERFFRKFPLDSPVARYLSELDLEQLLRNLEVAATPLASLPCYCRAETLRTREALQRELKTLDEAFAAIEHHGVDFSALRSDLRMARGKLERRIQMDDEWSARESAGPSSPTTSSPSRHYHRHTQSDPGPSVTPYGAQYSPSSSRSSTSSVRSAPAALPPRDPARYSPPAGLVTRSMSMNAAPSYPSHALPHAAYVHAGHAQSTGAVPTRAVHYYHQ
ncbi:hypothetical protein EXIGLDRAFT_771422 [Exidia glandulosa HHB12029]|uniref:Uncharacterized protein n=1 Tax=Exidia glandulosa HHB12029 TaxID=1314781 RepID=A0A165G0Y1_EXIGL|nr:hypothetical protein EXIGLDRAFT_771422 [Exidia glandulosa HHB12029]